MRGALGRTGRYALAILTPLKMLSRGVGDPGGLGMLGVVAKCPAVADGLVSGAGVVAA